MKENRSANIYIWVTGMKENRSAKRYIYISVAATHNHIPCCPERRFKYAKKAAETCSCWYCTDLTKLLKTAQTTKKKERCAYNLCGADQAGWKIKKPYYTVVEKKNAVYNYMSGVGSADEIKSDFGVPGTSLRMYTLEVKTRLRF